MYNIAIVEIIYVQVGCSYTIKSNSKVKINNYRQIKVKEFSDFNEKNIETTAASDEFVILRFNRYNFYNVDIVVEIMWLLL